MCSGLCSFLQDELVASEQTIIVQFSGCSSLVLPRLFLPHLFTPRIKLHILSLVVICSSSNVGSCLCQELGLSARQHLIIKHDIHPLVREFLGKFENISPGS